VSISSMLAEGGPRRLFSCGQEERRSYTAKRRLSSWRSQSAIGFQLANVRLA
jgi:hypothetical protein